MTAWDAQFLIRYHTVPLQTERQTVGAHSYAVSVLLNQLWPDSSKQLILSALYHDVAEVILGDIPATAKWGYPELRKAFEKAETQVMKSLELDFVLTKKEKDRLKMADMLELVMYCNRHSSLPQMKMIRDAGNDYLLENFINNKDFEPVASLLRHLGLD
jgi:5'-deoxynucleotidase YfbR-like HD superfamily hydrolase